MSFVVKKRDLTDPAQLQALIVEHVDDLERGLTILDSRLLLGQVAIDVVAIDADGALVLMTLGLVADEEMLLKAVDAYSWCLEYPEAIRRLYPNVEFSAARPPRVMFVVERMPDAFHRKIKQLGFAEVDCIEFRHLDVDGTAAIYFDSLARLRRAAPAAAEHDNHAAIEHNRPAPPPLPSGRPTSVKLQKLLGADRQVAVRAPAPPVVRIVHRAPPQEEAKPAAKPTRTEAVAAPRHTADSGRKAAPTVETLAAVVAPPAASIDVAASSFTEAVAGAATLPDAMVEPFVTIEVPRSNGRVDRPDVGEERPPVPASTVAVAPPVALPEPGTPDAFDSREVSVDIIAASTSTPEPAPLATAVVVPEPEAVIQKKPDVVIEQPTLVIHELRPVIQAPQLVLQAPEPLVEASSPMSEAPEPMIETPEPVMPTPELMIEAPEPVMPAPELVIQAPEMIIQASEPERLVQAPEVIQQPAIVPMPSAREQPLSVIPSAEAPEPDVIAASLTQPEPEVVSAVPSIAEPERIVVPTLELEIAPVIDLEPESQPLAAGLPELMPVAAEPMVQPLTLELESVAPAITSDPEPVVAPPSAESVESVEPIAPVITSTRSVFSRRAPEPAAPQTEPKVSFAGMSKDLLKQVNRPPQVVEAPASIERPSVEEITRATIDDLVGATDKPTAFAKPSGAFAKRPRTIAPTPSDGPPIAAGPKLGGGAAKRNSAPPPAAEPAAPAEGEAAPTVPDGFEGLQFPNDGVLTRQWMEFLNQMAAGK